MPTDSGPEPPRQLVVFVLHGERYGLPITCVREIIRYVRPTATAAARGIVQGMIAQRGRVLPVVDMSALVGQAPAPADTSRILIVELANGELGLVVDRVEGVVLVPAEQISSTPAQVAQPGIGEELAAVGEQLLVLIEPQLALGAALPAMPARRRAAPARTPKPPASDGG